MPDSCNTSVCSPYDNIAFKVDAKDLFKRPGGGGVGAGDAPAWTNGCELSAPRFRVPVAVFACCFLAFNADIYG